MKRHVFLRIVALGVCLALLPVLPGVTEELGETDLYDPAIRGAEAVNEGLETEAPGLAWSEDGQVAQPVVEEAEESALPFEELDDPHALEKTAGGDVAEGLFADAEPQLAMGLGETFALGGTVVNYQSDNPQVATVDSVTGVVRAVSLGSTRITAQRRDGATVSCVVTVLSAPTALAFEAQEVTLGKGEGFALAAKLPEGTASATILYASSDKGVVTVDAAGRLKAKKPGSALVGARTYNGMKAVCKVTVLNAPTKVKLSATKLILGKGEAAQLTATLPARAASHITWRSSDESVVTVGEDGSVRAVAPGSAVVRASAFNGKKADCKVRVLDGATPTVLSLGAASLELGVGEKRKLEPVLGAGEAALFAFASSDKAVAAVTSKGVIKAKKKGEVTVGVATHNGLKATVQVRVMKAPSKVVLSQTAITVEAGQSAQLEAKLPSGTASTLTWESSDESIATVDAAGRVTGVKAGSAAVRAKTFNGKYSPLCAVTVTAAGGQGEAQEEEQTPTTTPSAERMAARLRASSALGGKRDAIASVVGLMVSAGFKPAFAAGVGANIYSEGTYGLFESSRYIANYKKRPRYFCYLDGGDYYTYSGGDYKLTAVYMSKEEMASYTGAAEARERFDVENYYMDNYSGKYVHEIDLNALEAFMDRLAEGNWEGKFGVGIVQWTGGRTRTLAKFYRKHAGAGNAAITAKQVAAAENEMILYDFKGDYKGVYTTWKSENASALSSEEAARSAGALVCTKYEIPVDKESKAVVRGAKAVEIYRIMMGK